MREQNSVRGFEDWWEDNKLIGDSLMSKVELTKQWSRESWNHQQKKIEKLQAELDELRSGTKGACHACEPVGELNVKLQAKLEASENKNKEWLKLDTVRKSILCALDKKLKIAAKALKYYRGIAVKELGLVASEALEKINEVE